jgi:predicted nucleic acid-binding protein
LRFVVADASALLEYAFVGSNGNRIGSIVGSDDVDVWVPALCDVEFAAGIRRSLIRGLVSDRRAAEAVEDYLDLPLVRFDHQSLVPRMLELRANFTAYDATYVALAEALGAEVLTTDARLARAVRTHTRLTVLP